MVCIALMTLEPNISKKQIIPPLNNDSTATTSTPKRLVVFGSSSKHIIFAFGSLNTRPNVQVPTYRPVFKLRTSKCGPFAYQQ